MRFLQRNLLIRFEELSMKLGETLSDDEMNKVIEEHGKIQDQIEACDGWNLDSRLDLAMEALRGVEPVHYPPWRPRALAARKAATSDCASWRWV